MSHARHVLIVAGWEFRRFFKWKDQIIGLALFGLVSVVWSGAAMVVGAKGRTITLAQVGFEIPSAKDGRFAFVPAAPDEVSRNEALLSGKVQGILSRRTDGSYELLVAKEPRYRADLLPLLDEINRRERLAKVGISEEELEKILAPAGLDVRFTDPALGRRGKAEKIVAVVFIGILLMAVFTSLAYLMTGITGEKQLRVTESVVSAISPQAWIDGKVLGITTYALASVVNLLVGAGMVALAAQMASGFTLPAVIVRPFVIATFMVFTILGLLLWNSFFAAVASTIDDINTSSRSSLLFLPLLPVVLSIAVLRDPDALVARFLALFPLTSAPALPMRLVLSDPGVAEIAVAVGLLLAAIWFMRRLAGGIFELGILLYGKEPTLREMIRWATDRRGHTRV